MILINLLPHRALARQRARQRFKLWSGVAVLAGAAIASAIYLLQRGAIDRQLARNALLGTEVARLDEQIREVASLRQEIAALQSRQAAVESLQADRNLPVQLLNEAVSQLPDGVVLRSIKQDGPMVLLTGMAQSNQRVSELLRRLSRGGDRVTQPELVEIVAAELALGASEQRRAYHFIVRARLQGAGDDAPASAASAERAATRR